VNIIKNDYFLSKMTIIIKKADTKEQIEKKLSRLNSSSNKQKGFNAMKYLGKGIFGETDGLNYQKKVRNEWGK